MCMLSIYLNVATLKHNKNLKIILFLIVIHLIN